MADGLGPGSPPGGHLEADLDELAGAPDARAGCSGPAFYLHVGVLLMSLIVRIVGDLVDALGRRRGRGGLLSGVALLLFMFNTAVRWPWEKCMANPSEMPGATTLRRWRWPPTRKERWSAAFCSSAAAEP